MRIVEIKATEHIEECWDLLLAHREELATHKDIMPLKPDVARYKKAEEAGGLLTLAVLDDECNIVGYSVTILTHALHYESLKMAINDLIFLRKDLRGAAIGLKLILETMRVSKEKLGGGLITFHAKKDTAFAEILPKLGFEIQDIIYSKVL